MLVLLYCTIPGNSERISFAGEARTRLPVLYKYKEGFTNCCQEASGHEGLALNSSGEIATIVLFIKCPV